MSRPEDQTNINCLRGIMKNAGQISNKAWFLLECDKAYVLYLEKHREEIENLIEDIQSDLRMLEKEV